MSLNRHRFQNFLHTVQKLRLSHTDFLEFGIAASLVICFPIDSGIIFFELCKSHFVIIGSRVAKFGSRTRNFCKSRLYLHYVCRFLCCCFGIVARESEKFLHILHKFITNLESGGIIVDIILLLSKRKASLTHLYEIFLAVFQICIGSGIDITLYAVVRKLCGGIHNLFGSFHILYNVKILCYGLHTILVLSHGVHCKIVKVAYLLLDSAFALLFSCKVFDKSANLFFVVLIELFESAESRIISGERVAFHPASASKFIEIVAGIHLCVHIFFVNSGGKRGIAARSSETRQRKC